MFICILSLSSTTNNEQLNHGNIVTAFLGSYFMLGRKYFPGPLKGYSGLYINTYS